MQIHLKCIWDVGAEIGKGGFGHVYTASGPDCPDAVAKFVPIEPGASRELLFVNLPDSLHRIPVIDHGEHEGQYVLIMPRAETSLRSRLMTDSRLTEDQIVEILTDIAAGLSELAQEVVHRDIKPENILYLQGKWRLADFGIARYAEAATSNETHKFHMTPEYAAPEQWRGDRVTHATDVYALGVVAYEMVQAVRPFVSENLRHEHTTVRAPMATACSPSLAALIDECLVKPPQARPSAQNLLARLPKLAIPRSAAQQSLAAANALVQQTRAEEHAAAARIQSEYEVRHELDTAAADTLRRLANTLLDQIFENAPASEIRSSLIKPDPLLNVRLGPAQLLVQPIQQFAKPAPSHAQQKLFDVVCASEIYLLLPNSERMPSGMSHALWYCDAETEGLYRWYEVAFQVSPMTGLATQIHPLSLWPGEDAFFALSNTTHSYDCFWQPLPFDMGNEEQFFERWITWFAEYAAGNRVDPQHHPDRVVGKHRTVIM